MKDKRKKCLLDFDGTIVDNRRRLYSFFLDHIPTEYRSVLSEEDFWRIKRQRINEIEWINRTCDTELSVSEYSTEKSKHIEDDIYLEKERIFPFSVAALDRIHQKYVTVVVTRRENTEGLMREIEIFGLHPFFDDVIVLKHDGTDKSEGILRKYEVDNDDMVVGDTEDDIKTGIDLNCKMFFVLSGIRNRDLINEFNYPNISVIDDISVLL